MVNVAFGAKSALTADAIAAYFDRIYIINLPERVDRRKHIEQEVRKLGLASDSEKVQFFNAIKPLRGYPFASKGSHGCFMSHLTILQEAQRLGLKRVLILEDDAVFTPDFLQAQSQFVEQMTAQPWHLIQFGYGYLSTIPPQDRVNAAPNTPSETLLPFAKDVICTHCCAFNGEHLPALIRFLEELLATPPTDTGKVTMGIDGAYNVFSRQPGVNRLLPKISLVKQASSRSDITPRFYDQVPLVRSAIALLRNSGVIEYLRTVKATRTGQSG